MTRKDYIKFAEMIRVNKRTFAGYELDALDFIKVQIADIFERDRSQFNREKFYKACEPEE